MPDAIFLFTIVGFFLLCALYVKGCDRIIGRKANSRSSRTPISTAKASRRPSDRAPAERAA